ncbi:MAG: hypothetical protein KAI29_16655, partial [Cyclobacteriaceae bacterium]|nr:hypothetical protein [Cyclobacteriaceae bacterium]
MNLKLEKIFMRKTFKLMMIIGSVFISSSIYSIGLTENLKNSTENIFYLSPNGNDENTGTKEHPFLTLERAKLAIKSIMGKAITIYLREGYYPLENTFVLSKDELSYDTPITIASYPGEKAHIIGGKEIHGFKALDPESEVYEKIEPEFRDNILAVNLIEKGITEFGKLSARGMGRAIQASGLALYFNEKPMT